MKDFNGKKPPGLDLKFRFLCGIQEGWGRCHLQGYPFTIIPHYLLNRAFQGYSARKRSALLEANFLLPLKFISRYAGKEVLKAFIWNYFPSKWRGCQID